MSSIATQIFDQASKASLLVSRLDRLNKDLRQLRPNCGHCQHWMKSRECPREAKGLKPSMNDPICKSYSEKDDVTQRRRDLVEDRRLVVADINS